MASHDLYNTYASGITGPIEYAAAVTPADDADLDWITRSIMVAADGDVAGVLKGGTSVVLTNLQAGVVYPFRFRRIAATGTTATGILGLW